MLNACVVDQNINAAKFLLGKLHHGFNFGGLAHVGTVIGHFGTQCRNFSFGSGMVAKAIQNNVGALLAKALAMPKPMPLVEPVTSAVLPFSMVVLRMNYDV
jgi:hypothetical protein